MERALVRIARRYSARQALRAWNIPFTAIDMIVQPHPRIEKEVESADKIFNDVIVFFAKVDDAIVVLNCGYASKDFLDANLAVTNQERIHKAVYDRFLEWWQMVRPSGLDDGDVSVAAVGIEGAGMPGFVAVNFLLERCALPLVFEAMHQVKHHIVSVYGEPASEVYNINDEVIADETDHGKQFLECWELVKGEVDQDAFMDTARAVWNMIAHILVADVEGYQTKFWKLVNGESIQLLYNVDTQSARQFEGARQGYVNIDMAKQVETLAKRKADSSDDVPKRRRVAELVQSTSEALARVMDHISN